MADSQRICWFRSESDKEGEDRGRLIRPPSALRSSRGDLPVCIAEGRSPRCLLLGKSATWSVGGDRMVML